MPQHLAAITLLIPTYDEGIGFFRDVLGFELVEDTPLDGGKRWVVVRPRGAGATGLLLAQPADDAQEARVGDQTGGRVFLFLHTDDFAGDHERYVAAGVRFLEQPREEEYGMVAVFEDPFGNRWDLLGPP
jgi:catechol 2,3-dioxygenase-like lactoylglutathione lyase family enzyme